MIIIMSDLYSAFNHVNMFKCTLQESTELKVERIRSSATAANKYFIYDNASSRRNRPHNVGVTTLLLKIYVCEFF